MKPSPKDRFKTKLEKGDLVAGVVGLGYVGLPLAMLFAETGFSTIGFDTDERKTKLISRKKSYIDYIPDRMIARAVENGFTATHDFKRLGKPDVISICVPTPLNENREPDLQYVRQTAEAVARTLRPGQLVILESTTYPGTTEELVRPILASTKLKVGKDFFLAYSPEREDPNNPDFTAKKIPKVLGGVTRSCLQLSRAFYEKAFNRIVPVSSPKVAEMAKLLENIYRSVNIALVNELKVVTDAMGINVWEVIEAAKTKPFGFTPFYPGPGLGGHCIPIDPFYLTWKARQYGLNTRFIELAGEVNTSMPAYVVQKTVSALNQDRKPIAGSRVLVLGVAYKKNVDDVRESPALEIIRELQEWGADVSYHDPHVKAYPSGRKGGLGLQSKGLSKRLVEASDVVLILTDHDKVDYQKVADHARLIVDTRNAMSRITQVKGRVVLA